MSGDVRAPSISPRRGQQPHVDQLPVAVLGVVGQQQAAHVAAPLPNDQPAPGIEHAGGPVSFQDLVDGPDVADAWAVERLLVGGLDHAGKPVVVLCAVGLELKRAVWAGGGELVFQANQVKQVGQRIKPGPSQRRVVGLRNDLDKRMRHAHVPRGHAPARGLQQLSDQTGGLPRHNPRRPDDGSLARQNLRKLRPHQLPTTAGLQQALQRHPARSAVRQKRLDLLRLLVGPQVAEHERQGLGGPLRRNRSNLRAIFVSAHAGKILEFHKWR